jgi:hypothetical protein
VIGTASVLPYSNLGDMRITAVVLHNGSLAHYTVLQREDGSFEARLLRYSGKGKEAPPPAIWFVKDGRHCTGNQELMDEPCAAVELEKERQSGGDTRVAA